MDYSPRQNKWETLYEMIQSKDESKFRRLVEYAQENKPSVSGSEDSSHDSLLGALKSPKRADLEESEFEIASPR